MWSVGEMGSDERCGMKPIELLSFCVDTYTIERVRFNNVANVHVALSLAVRYAGFQDQAVVGI